MSQSELAFSVITVCYNSIETIKKCLESVQFQEFDSYEHIVVDGLSNDGTLDVLGSYVSPHMHYISEADDGIYDAMNKGISLARGKYIAILNSDDYFADRFVLKTVHSMFERFSSDIVYSGIGFIDRNANFISEWQPEMFSQGDYKRGFHTPHPGFFTTSKMYAELGKFDVRMPIAADFDLMLRFMESEKSTCTLLTTTTVIMRVDGESSSLRNILRGFSDIRLSFRKNNIKIFWPSYAVKRYVPKLKRKILIFLMKIRGK